MKKFVLLAGIAALAAMPATAYADGRDGHGGGDRNDSSITTSFDESVSIDVEYDNYLNASIDADVEYDKKLALFGGAVVRGYINVNSSAVAISDPKQIIEANTVKTPGSNANSSFIGNVDGKGNIGVNSAAGNLNQQANIASIASAPGGGNNDKDSRSNDRDGNSGWAEATTVSLQKVLGNSYYGGGVNSSNVNNVSGFGNIGVNSAAGAFNAQENVLTMAVVKDGALAEANSGLLQTTYDNSVELSAGANNSNIGHVGGEGNIGVNSASGVGNIQSNILTIAVSSN